MTHEDDVREIRAVAARVSALEAGHAELAAKVDENTRVTTSIKSDTAHLVDFVQAYKATKLVGGIAGQFLLWLALVGGGLAGMWAAWKTGGKP